jgi:hypothetical protein
MPGTLSDFITQFTGGGAGASTAQEAAQLLSRFASNHPADQAFDSTTMHQGATEYLGQLPPAQFQQASQTAYAQANPAQQQSLLTTLLSGLEGQGVGLGSLAGMLGLGSTNPQQMTANDFTRMADYVRTQHPAIMQQAVAQHPWLMQAMGNPIVTGALGLIAAKMVSNLTRH